MNKIMAKIMITTITKSVGTYTENMSSGINKRDAMVLKKKIFERYSEV